MAKVCNFRGFAGLGFGPDLAGSGNGSVLGSNCGLVLDSLD